jgi:PAS domain S-box-containing protein
MARLYANKVKKDKKKLENIVYRSTEEIRKQNEEILYQNAKILKQKEEIQEKAKQLESANAELEKLSIVASETNNAVVIANKDGRVEWINQGFVRLYGYTLEELRSHYGTYLQNFNPNADFSKIKPNNKMKSRESVFESVIKTKNDEIVEVQTTLTPIYNEQGEIFKYVVIDTDIRDLKRYENELKKLVTTKDKFFSIIAHDLKNPFNSILGATSILINKKDKLDKERIQYFHGNIYNVAQQGYDLLENLLEWARSQTGRLDLKFERLNLYELSNEAIGILRSNADNKQIEIINKINKNYEVVADKNTVKTVFRNLLSNAIKYTNPKGKVILNAESEGKYKKVSISDTGIGIPKKYLSKIFKVDVQYSRKGTAEESGTGLGLILCKEFVEKNNGKIFVQSVEGEGSIFYFTLPDKQKNL